MTEPREEQLENGKAPENPAVDEVPAESGAPSDPGREEGRPAPGPETDAEPDAGSEPGPDLEPERTEEERLRDERDAFEAKWLRVVAELDNVRKRGRRELGDARRFAQADVLRRFLDVLDDFDRALQSADAGDDTAGPDGFREGVALISQNFRTVLKDLGVESIAALDAEFDPNVHEAVAQIPVEGVEAGRVVEVVAEGFMFGELVLRPSRVVIAS